MKRSAGPLAAILIIATFTAWIAVPNILHARNRARQKRTMADMRTIATAWEARATDVNSYSIDGASRQAVKTSDVARALEPKYVRKLPRTDGWGTEFQYSLSEYDSAGRARTYVIRSLGSDAKRDPISDPAGGETFKFSDDLIYSNGSFVRYPESEG